MTAPTRNTVTLFDATVNAGIASKKDAAAASTPATGNGGWIDVSGYNGGVISAVITNGSSGPATPLKYVIQGSDASGAGANVTEIRAAAGDTAGSATGYPISATIPLRSEFKYIRVLSWGHITNNVGLKVLGFMKA